MCRRTKTTEKHVLLKSFVGLTKGWNNGSGLVQLTKQTIHRKLANKQVIHNFSNTDLDQHCSGNKHLYYSSYYSYQNKIAYWAIDNDMKDRDIDKYEGELTDLYYWEETVLPLFFPGIKAFRSKGGIGSHCHIAVIPGKAYESYSFYFKNKKAKELAVALEKELETFRRHKGYKFSKVEIKGTNTVVNWKTGDISFGSLCLLPRTDEHIDYIKNQIPFLTFEKIENLIIKLRNYNNTIEKSLPNQIVTNDLVTRKVCKSENVTGSQTGKIVTINDEYGKFYCEKVLQTVLRPDSDKRYVCNEKDITIFISIIKALSDADMKAYGQVKQMSFKRIKGMWNALFDAGDIDVCFNDKKITAMRNSLSENGFIEWISEKYCANKACSFKISDEFFILLEKENTHTPSCIVTTVAIRGSCEHKKPVFDESVNPFVIQAVKFAEAEDYVLSLCG